jgi:1,2-phenylacetyl-CoA epoxidase catalytic subunit
MKKTTKKKSFDCVEMMHEGALRIHEELKGKTREEQLAYWREQDEEARRKHPRLRSLKRTDAAAR